MDITSNNNNNTTAAATAISTVKTTEAETETQSHTPIRIQPVKPISFSNGVLKRHNSVNNHHPVVVLYKECLKNHAASLGGHAVDGCGEFMPSPSANPTDPTSLKCAACGCHRNFHRREPEDQPPFHSSTPALEYQPHHRHHPPPPPPPPLQHGGDHSSPNNSPSPPPISSAYYPASAPHMLLALSTGLSGQPDSNNPLISPTPNPISAPNLSNPNGRKRFRTKFTQNQKERMLEFAERVGWKMQKRDEDVINEFCNNIGVEKGVLKVWMHNNKNTFGRKSDQPPSATVNTTTAATTITHLNGNANGFGLFSRNNNTDNNTTAATEFHLHHHHESSNDNDKDHSVSAHNVVTTNGSSTSS